MLYETERLNSPAIARLGAWPDTIGVVCTGATEQHGPHLPVSTDSAIARRMQQEIGARMSRPVLSTPVIDVALSDMHRNFAGTITIGADVYRALVTAHLDSLYRCGVRRLAVLDFNAPNMAASQQAADAFAAAHPDAVVACQSDLAWLMTSLWRRARPDRSGAATPDHAGRLETSIGLALFGAEVGDFEGVVGFTDFERAGWWDQMVDEGMDSLAANGVVGTTEGASAEAGRAALDGLADDLVDWLTEHLGRVG